MAKPVVVAVLNQKGGSGKTTLATNLAYSFNQVPLKTLLVDADPQGSARDWRAMNPESSLPVVGLDRETIGQDLGAIASSYERVLIDGAPHLQKMSVAIIKIADCVLIPVQPSPYDIWACLDLVELIQTRQSITGGSPKAAFIISRAIQNTKLSQEIKQALLDYHLPIFKSFTTQRVVYPTTAALGQSVLTAPDPNPAATEIINIRQEVEAFLNGSSI